MHKKLFSAFVAIILLLSILLGFYSISISKKYYMEQYSEHLLKEAGILTILFEEGYQKGNTEFMSEFVSRFSKKLNCRLTIIDEKGAVVKDSETDESIMENHKGRDEVIQALEKGIGLSMRYSNSLQTHFIYAASSAQVGEDVFVLRMAVPLKALDRIKNQLIIYIFGGITVSAFFSFLLAYYLSGKMAAPLNELTQAADDISRGNYGKKIPIANDEEIGLLTRAFNRMSQELNVTIDRLEEENSKLESIVNSMMNGVIAINNENKIIMINYESYRLFHIKINQIIGYNFYDIIRNEDIYKALNMSIKHKTHVSVEFLLKGPLEGDKILRLHVNPIKRNGQGNREMGSLLVFQDVTQIRKLEKLRNDFVSNVTHELKTPLTSIMGFTDTLKQGAVYNAEAALRFIDIIDIESQRLYRLIQDILSLSEIETRGEDVNVSPNDIRLILDDVINILKPAAEAKNLTLDVKISEDVPLFLCNKDRITQMFINLIENAIKYTETGGVSVTGECHQNELEFRVGDTGIGIPEESHFRIFERFYRVDKGRSRKAGGTGLGLSIVKHIVMLYGGNVAIESKEGEGSIFIIKLPIKKKTV